MMKKLNAKQKEFVKKGCLIWLEKINEWYNKDD